MAQVKIDVKQVSFRLLVSCCDAGEWFALQSVWLPCFLCSGEAMLIGLVCDKGRSHSTNCLVRMSTGPECHGTIFLSPGNILRISQSTKSLAAGPTPNVLLCQTGLWRVDSQYFQKKCAQNLHRIFYRAMHFWKWIVSSPCWPFPLKKEFIDNIGASPGVKDTYVWVFMISGKSWSERINCMLVFLKIVLQWQM